MPETELHPEITTAIADCATALVAYNTRLEQLAEQVEATLVSQSEKVRAEQTALLERFLQNANVQRMEAEKAMAASLVASTRTFSGAVDQKLTELHGTVDQLSARAISEQNRWASIVTDADTRLQSAMAQSAEAVLDQVRTRTDETLLRLEALTRKGLDDQTRALTAWQARHDRHRLAFYLLHLITLATTAFLVYRQVK